MNDARAALLVLTDIGAERENDFHHRYADERAPDLGLRRPPARRRRCA